MRIVIEAESNNGLKRPHNEDMILLGHSMLRDGSASEEISIKKITKWAAVIADGMGGHKGGERASEIACQHFDIFLSSLPPHLNSDQIELRLEQWAEDTHASINAHGDADETLTGMGTTLTGIFFYEEKMHWLNIGDSRVYILRDNNLRQITSDHTLSRLMNDPTIPPNILSNCLGGDAESTFVDTDEIPVYTGDRFLICSDGLTDMLDNNTLYQLMSEDAPAASFVHCANEQGGIDNISIIKINIL